MKRLEDAPVYQALGEYDFNATIDELGEILQKSKEQKIAKIILSSALGAANAVFWSNLLSVVGTGVATYKLIRYIIRTIIHNKRHALKVFAKDSQRLVKNAVADIKNFIKYSTKAQKINFVMDSIIFTTTVLVVGGGLDFEGGLPDVDLKFGVKYHRNLFTHAIPIGFLMEFSIRFVVNLLKEYRKIHPIKSKLLNDLLDYIQARSKIVISGMWLGLAIHFLKDAGLLSNRIKPYVGLHGFSMTQHKGIFAANSILSFIFSRKKK